MKPGVAIPSQILGHPVARNALALYGVQIANYIFPMITIPYLTRVLHPDGWGLVLMAQSFSLWLGLVLEYGFNLSATREISRHQGQEFEISLVVDGVLGAKLILLLGTLAGVPLALKSVALFREHHIYLWLAWLSAVAQGFNPLWYFQGLERMELPAALDVASRALCTVLTFLCVKHPDDGWRVLALQTTASALATGATMAWMYREVPFRWPTVGRSVSALRSGWSMFFFRSAVSLYTTANAFILGLFVPPAQVGFYGGAEKIAKAILAMLNPASQALYPRMNSLIARDSKHATQLARSTLMFFGVVGVSLGVMVAGAAPLLIRVLLGPAYEPAIPVLRVLAILIPVIALSNVLGIQWMLPLGLDRIFNAIIFSAGFVNICLAVFLAPRFGPIGMAWAVVLSELFVTASMFLLLCKSGYNLLKGEKV